MSTTAAHHQHALLVLYFCIFDFHLPLFYLLSQPFLTSLPFPYSSWNPYTGGHQNRTVYSCSAHSLSGDKLKAEVFQVVTVVTTILFFTRCSFPSNSYHNGIMTIFSNNHQHENSWSKPHELQCTVPQPVLQIPNIPIYSHPSIWNQPRYTFLDSTFQLRRNSDIVFFSNCDSSLQLAHSPFFHVL